MVISISYTTPTAPLHSFLTGNINHLVEILLITVNGGQCISPQCGRSVEVATTNSYF